MRAPSAILRSLPLRQLQPRGAAAVASLPEETRFGGELTEVLDTLLSQGSASDEIGMAQLLDAAIASQKIALDSLVKISCRDEYERGLVDEYLETNVEVLDACNYFVDKIDHIKKYVDSLRVAARLVDSGSAKPNVTTRASELLESSQSVQKRCKSMGKCGSCLRKLLRQKPCHDESEFKEIMCGSKAMALMCCRFLELGLSFDSKLGLPSMKQSQPASSLWLRLLMDLANQGSGEKKMQKRRPGTSLLMTELHQTVIAARELKEQMKGKREKEVKSAVERLKKSCRKLEDGLVIIEERVKDLYKSLIDVRMALMGILSQA